MEDDRLEGLAAALDRAALTDDERRSFFAYLAFSAAATAAGTQPKPILALIGTLAAAAGVKEQDTPQMARDKIDRYFIANPPAPKAIAAFKAWLDSQRGPAAPLSAQELATLMIAEHPKHRQDTPSPATAKT